MPSFIDIHDNVKIVKHLTHEIVQLLPEKCDLIVTMNVTVSLLKRVASKDRTILYFVSCSIPPNPFVKEAYPVATCHLKLYLTPSRLVISTANLSLSSFDELSVIVPRSPVVEEFCRRVVRELKLRNQFVVAFH